VNTTWRNPSIPAPNVNRALLTISGADAGVELPRPVTRCTSISLHHAAWMSADHAWLDPALQCTACHPCCAPKLAPQTAASPITLKLCWFLAQIPAHVKLVGQLLAEPPRPLPADLEAFITGALFTRFH
jgi:hypothetical protein